MTFVFFISSELPLMSLLSMYWFHFRSHHFYRIKQQQGLLINFNEFEQKVADLLCICSQEEAIETPK